MRLSASSSMPLRQFVSAALLAAQPSLITPSLSLSTPPLAGASLHVPSGDGPYAGQPSLTRPSASLSARSLHCVSGAKPTIAQPSLRTPSASLSVVLPVVQLAPLSGVPAPTPIEE